MHQDTLSWTFKLEDLKTGSQPNEVFTERISDTWQFCLQEIFVQAVCFPGWHNRPILSVRASERAALCGIYQLTHTHIIVHIHTQIHTDAVHWVSVHLFALLLSLSFCPCSPVASWRDQQTNQTTRSHRPSTHPLLSTCMLLLQYFFYFVFVFALLMGHSILHQWPSYKV